VEPPYEAFLDRLPSAELFRREHFFDILCRSLKLFLDLGLSVFSNLIQGYQPFAQDRSDPVYLLLRQVQLPLEPGDHVVQGNIGIHRGAALGGVNEHHCPGHANRDARGQNDHARQSHTPRVHMAQRDFRAICRTHLLH
jgi:hypothetical protein